MNDASDTTTGHSMTPTHGVWMVVGTALAGLVVLGVIFRRTGSSD